MTKQTKTTTNNTPCYFDKIAGYHAEKKMMSDLANLIKNREDLKKMGGRLPKGLLLLGDNGLGKTELAKAFVKTANVYTVSINCSSIDDDTFKTYIDEKFMDASKHTPSIIFIDELDKITGSNTSISTGNNFSHFKDMLFTINEYLGTEDMFILACANEDYEIDKGLVRSGRFDRIIHLNPPTQSERVEIFKLFAKDKKIDAKVNYLALAKATNGLVGADIEVVMNEATIQAFNDHRKTINSRDIEKCISEMKFGPLEKESEFDDQNLKILAAHEAGHAVAAMALIGKHLNRLTVAKHGDVEGYLESMIDEQEVTSLNDRYNRVVIALAGREAERLLFNNIYAGSEDDISKAHHIVSNLVASQGAYGYEYLILALRQRKFNATTFENREPSQARLERIEALEDALMSKAMKQAKDILKTHKAFLEQIMNELVIEKTLTSDELDKLYDDYFGKIKMIDGTNSSRAILPNRLDCFVYLK